MLFFLNHPLVIKVTYIYLHALQSVRYVHLISSV